MEAVLTVEMLDEGVECRGPHGGRWHFQIAINDDEWRKGDIYYVLDRHGVPRPLEFRYAYTGNGSVTCYARQRFRPKVGGSTVAVGYVEVGRRKPPLMPERTAMTMSPIELRVRQLMSDLIEAGHESAAHELLEAFELGDTLELEHAEIVAARLLEHLDEDQP